MDHEVVVISLNNWLHLPKLFMPKVEKIWDIVKGRDIIQLSLVQNMHAKFSQTTSYKDEK